jgi:hypothetical protein
MMCEAKEMLDETKNFTFLIFNGWSRSWSASAKVPLQR